MLTRNSAQPPLAQVPTPVTLPPAPPVLLPVNQYQQSSHAVPLPAPPVNSLYVQYQAPAPVPAASQVPGVSLQQQVSLRFHTQ
jgi:hypothetical protein